MLVLFIVHRSSYAIAKDDELAAEQSVTCDCVFVEPLQWMGELHGTQGPLHCPNPSCKREIGKFCWRGLE